MFVFEFRNNSHYFQKKKNIPLDLRSLKMKLVMRKKYPRNKVMASKLNLSLLFMKRLHSKAFTLRDGELTLCISVVDYNVSPPKKRKKGGPIKSSHL